MRAHPAICGFARGLGAWALVPVLVGCATSGPPPAPPPHPAQLDPNEEKVISLGQQVEAQEAEIRRLTAAVHALTAKMQAKPQKPESTTEEGLPLKGSPAARASEAKPLAPAITKLHPHSAKGDEVDDDGMAEEIEAIKAAKAPPAPSAEPAPVASAAQKPAPPLPVDEEGDDDGDGSLIADGDSTIVVDSSHEAMHLYYQGLRLMEQKNYDGALNHFRDFLKLNPDHVYADRAEYLIAQSHFLNREYGLVIVETNLLEAKYPYSFRIPEAIFERALSYEGMGQSDEAKAALRDLMKKFPKSSFADRASRRLAEMAAPAARSGIAPRLMNDVQ